MEELIPIHAGRCQESDDGPDVHCSSESGGRPSNYSGHYQVPVSYLKAQKESRRGKQRRWMTVLRMNKHRMGISIRRIDGKDYD